MNGKSFFRATLVAILLIVLFVSTGAIPARAGAPYPPDLISPADNETVSSNPPTLCAHATDPDGDPVSIRFESWGGGEANHNSNFIPVDGGGNACWTDSAPWSPGGHTWQARSQAQDGEAASVTRGVNIPNPPPQAPTCTINSLTSNPPPPQAVGTQVTISASASCTNGVASLKFSAAGQDLGTTQGASGSVTWNTSGLAAQDYSYSVSAADNVGGYIKSASDSYQLTSGTPPTPVPAWGPAISVVNFNPSGGAQVGVSVGIHVKVESSNPGAIRIYVPCGGIAPFESTVPEYNATWTTGSCGAGNQNVQVCARHVNDPNWAFATCVNRSYTLTSPPATAPTANFWADATSILQGQCTSLHWTTTNATTVTIDEGAVAASGDQQVCPNITKHYSLKAIGPGGEATRSLSIVVSALPTRTLVPPTQPPAPIPNTPTPRPQSPGGGGSNPPTPTTVGAQPTPVPSSPIPTQPGPGNTEPESWCTARVEAVDEGGGNFFDQGYFLYVWLPDPPSKDSYYVTFRGLIRTTRIGAEVNSDAGDYLRYGIHTWFAYLNWFTWRDSSRWQFHYKCP